VQGWLALLQGNLVSPPARRKPRWRCRARGAAYGESYTLALLAQVRVELDDHAGTAECLAQFRTRLGGVSSPMFDFNVLLVEAYGALRQHDHDGCAAALHVALAIGRCHDYAGTLFWYPRMMASLCAFALEHHVEEEYAAALIRRRRLRAPAPIENWPWQVKIHARPLCRVRERRRARFDGRRSVPLELLKGADCAGRPRRSRRFADRRAVAPSDAGRRAEGARDHDPPAAQAAQVRRVGAGERSPRDLDAALVCGWQRWSTLARSSRCRAP
jgi:hypothetical protein